MRKSRVQFAEDDKKYRYKTKSEKETDERWLNHVLKIEHWDDIPNALKQAKEKGILKEEVDLEEFLENVTSFPIQVLERAFEKEIELIHRLSSVRDKQVNHCRFYAQLNALALQKLREIRKIKEITPQDWGPEEDT